jgi:hypothetical protein
MRRLQHCQCWSARLVTMDQVALWAPSAFPAVLEPLPSSRAQHLLISVTVSGVGCTLKWQLAYLLLVLPCDPCDVL